eukprot:scaffold4903_cov125-Cylindrotheca_fusiformis.AAC.2
MTSIPQNERIYHCLFVGMSIIMNLPAVIVGATGCRPWCDYFSVWLASNIALAAMNIIAAIYIVYRIQQAAASEEPTLRSIVKDDQARSQRNADDQDLEAPKVHGCAVSETSTDDDDIKTRKCWNRFGRTPLGDRIRHLVRYDKLMSTYCVLFVFWVFWLCDGVERTHDIEKADKDALKNCSSDHEDHVQVAFFLGFGYVACVVLLVVAAFVQHNH